MTRRYLAHRKYELVKQGLVLLAASENLSQYSTVGGDSVVRVGLVLEEEVAYTSVGRVHYFVYYRRRIYSLATSRVTFDGQ